MRSDSLRSMPRPVRPAALAIAALMLVVAFALPVTASAAPSKRQGQSKGSKAKKRGSLVQLAGKRGCVVDRSVRGTNCSFGRALKAPGPFMGSRAITLSPNGKQVYVASSGSDAIAIFSRDKKRGTLKQAKGTRGCIADKGAGNCATAIGLDSPNSLAISKDGRNLYATSRNSSSITTFRRDNKTGALTQTKPSTGCISGLPIPGCATGRALSGPDVVVISDDGKNVYAGSFIGSSISIFNRDPATGALTQPTDETGCITETATSGCGQGLALSSPEGMAISADGENVYVATAVSNAALSFTRDPSTGALTQPSDGSGCIVNAALDGCTTGTELSGANAVAISPDDNNAYVTSLISSSLTSFSRSGTAGALSQLYGSTGCVVWLGSDGCTLGRAMRAPEGVTVSPDGTNVYVAAYSSGAIAVLHRERKSGTVRQKSGAAGCITTNSIAQCSAGRSMAGTSSIAVSADGRFIYSTAAESNAVDVFRRVTGRR